MHEASDDEGSCIGVNLAGGGLHGQAQSGRQAHPAPEESAPRQGCFTSLAGRPK